MDNRQNCGCGNEKCGKVNKGIACSAKACHYNDDGGHCTAVKIAVGPSSATCCTDTVCATFKPKEEM